MGTPPTLDLKWHETVLYRWNEEPSARLCERQQLLYVQLDRTNKIHYLNSIEGIATLAPGDKVIPREALKGTRIKVIEGNDPKNDALQITECATGEVRSNLIQFLDGLHRTLFEVQKCHDQPALAVVGVTGAGKSLFVNVLRGVPICHKHNSLSLVVDEKKLEVGQPFSRVGSALFSETSITIPLPGTEKIKRIILDTGGIYDSRPIHSLLTPISTFLSLSSTKNVCIALSVDYGTLSRESENSTITFLEFLEGFFFSFEEAHKSVLFVVSKGFSKVASGHVNRESVVNSLNLLLARENLTPTQRKWLEYFLRDEGRHILIVPTRHPESILENALCSIHSLQPIMEPRLSFRPVFKDRDILPLVNDLVQEVTRITHIASEALIDLQEIRDLKRELTYLKDEKEIIQTVYEINSRDFERTKAQIQEVAARLKVQKAMKEATEKEIREMTETEREHALLTSVKFPKERYTLLTNAYHGEESCHFCYAGLPFEKLLFVPSLDSNYWQKVSEGDGYFNYLYHFRKYEKVSTFEEATSACIEVWGYKDGNRPSQLRRITVNNRLLKCKREVLDLEHQAAYLNGTSAAAQTYESEKKVVIEEYEDRIRQLKEKCMPVESNYEEKQRHLQNAMRTSVILSLFMRKMKSMFDDSRHFPYPFNLEIFEQFDKVFTTYRSEAPQDFIDET